MSITKKAVFEAATSLHSRKIHPSIGNIRKELGDTGSHTTISKYLTEWKLDNEPKEENDMQTAEVETERDNASFYAYERVEAYGKDYKEYSRRLTLTQSVVVGLLFPVYLAAGNNWAMLLCMAFALFIAFQFHAGLVAYLRLFMLGRGALRREYYPEEDINSDGAHWWINLWFGSRTLTFYALMFYTMRILARAILGA